MHVPRCGVQEEMFTPFPPVQLGIHNDCHQSAPAWAVAHYFSRTCEQSQFWCMTRFLALQYDDVLMCWCTHSSYLMHAAEMCCMTLVADIGQSILQLPQSTFKPNTQVHTCAGSECKSRPCCEATVSHLEPYALRGSWGGM